MKKSGVVIIILFLAAVVFSGWQSYRAADKLAAVETRITTQTNSNMSVANLVTSGTATIGTVASTTDYLVIGNSVANDDDNIYFDIGLAEYLGWDDDPGEFDLSDDLTIDGNFTCGAVASTTDYFVVGNSLGNDDDNIYFDIGLAEYIGWDDSPGEFDISDDLTVAGTLTVSGETGFRELTTAITATTTITAEQSGSTFYIAPANQTTITLPALADGLFYKFVISAAFADANTVIDSAEGDNIEGVILTGGVDYPCSGEDQIDFVADGELLGDFVELRSNGTNWFIGANGATTDAKITCTDPS